ncbi:Hypothetical protein, putative, partial [Bodo saltans]
IFDNRAPELEDYRVFALDPDLTSSCTVTDVASVLRENAGGSGTRVLVSPPFLRSVLECWSETSSSQIRRHLEALADTLEYHTDLATALVRAGKLLKGGHTYGEPSRKIAKRKYM